MLKALRPGMSADPSARSIVAKILAHAVSADPVNAHALRRENEALPHAFHAPRYSAHRSLTKTSQKG
ncbi:MAG: hypothetical protein AB7U75_10230 [Hyphomicrobiaceae bacterium]